MESSNNEMSFKNDFMDTTDLIMAVDQFAASFESADPNIDHVAKTETSPSIVIENNVLTQPIAVTFD
jgi:hypothetical protein